MTGFKDVSHLENDVKSLTEPKPSLLFALPSLLREMLTEISSERNLKTVPMKRPVISSFNQFLEQQSHAAVLDST
ncbi:MAG: hypothetical protein EAX81_01880 [Candidatus Thorarchaeota archaeon]|nr:hypothetical protein [Candidatus Thorarchaeota archaeon]